MRNKSFWNKRDGSDSRPTLKRTSKARVRRIDSREPIVIEIDGTEIVRDAYRGRTDLRHVIIPEGVTHIGTSAFYGCKRLKSVTLPSTLQSLGDYAFHGCKHLKSILIPEGVSNIGRRAFGDCKSLRSVTLPGDLVNFGSAAFGGCYALEYSYYEGGRYLGNARNPHLVCVKGAAELHPDTGIVASGAYAMSGIKHIIINSGVEHIGSLAFLRSRVEYIYIPHSIREIDADAFMECDALVNVSYNGTMDEWNTVYKGNAVPVSTTDSE